MRGLMRREEAGKDVCVFMDAYMSDTLKELMNSHVMDAHG